MAVHRQQLEAFPSYKEILWSPKQGLLHSYSRKIKRKTAVMETAKQIEEEIMFVTLKTAAKRTSRVPI